MAMSPSDISRSAQQIYQYRDDVKRDLNTIQREIQNSSGYWMGYAASTFHSEQNFMLNEQNLLIRNLQSLQQDMQRLSNEVRRADEDRAEKLRKAEIALRSRK